MKDHLNYCLFMLTLSGRVAVAELNMREKLGATSNW